MKAAREVLEKLMPVRGKRDSHPGLLLQRYLHESATGDNGIPDEKRVILQAAINAAKTLGLSDFNRAAFARWEKSFPDLTASNQLQSQGRLIVGLGTENVLETGIRLHHTFGLPILPGSALKGLAAHFCDQIWGAADNRFKKPTKEEDKAYKDFLSGEKPKPPDNYHRLFFGDTDDSGCIVFHDAWFVPDSEKEPLKLDVMTPHHPGWLDGAVAPTDFDSPTPVPFLSVSGKFLVAVSWQGPENYEKSVLWTEKAFELLLNAIGAWGIGGKTSSGYGRLLEIDPAKRKKPFSAAALGLPVVGAETDATLLEAPKKEKPWRASVKLRGGNELKGPIEGTSPSNLHPGATVRLTVTEVGERSIKFKWPQPSKK